MHLVLLFQKRPIRHNEMSIGHTEMSVRPSDKQKCPLDISNVHSSIGRTEMSIGHSNVHWTYRRGTKIRRGFKRRILHVSN